MSIVVPIIFAFFRGGTTKASFFHGKYFYFLCDPYVLSIRTAFVSGWYHDSKSSFPTGQSAQFPEREGSLRLLFH